MVYKGGVSLNDDEFSQIKESIESLERKIDKLSIQTAQKPGFLWREFWIGFGVVFVIMVVIFTIIGIINYHQVSHGVAFDPGR